MIAVESNGHLQVELFSVEKSPRPNGNAYKNFSIVRLGNYTSNLFEARENYDFFFCNIYIFVYNYSCFLFHLSIIYRTIITCMYTEYIIILQ